MMNFKHPKCKYVNIREVVQSFKVVLRLGRPTKRITSVTVGKT